MNKRLLLFMFVIMTGLLISCNELKLLEVEFDVPNTADVNETVTLKATVTYGGKPVKDPRQMDFEVWERGKKDESIWLEGENHQDGTYTAEVTFDRDGIFEMYAHTTAHDLHTMPRREIIVGEGGDYDDLDDEDHGFHTEGFDMTLIELEKVTVDSNIDITVQLHLEDDVFENANVQYEIWNDDGSGKHDWVDAKEIKPGQYSADYIFPEVGTYNVQVHVEDDEDLHEHTTYQIEVTD